MKDGMHMMPDGTYMYDNDMYMKDDDYLNVETRGKMNTMMKPHTDDKAPTVKSNSYSKVMPEPMPKYAGGGMVGYGHGGKVMDYNKGGHVMNYSMGGEAYRATDTTRTMSGGYTGKIDGGMTPVY